MAFGFYFAGLLWASLVQAEEKWIITHSEREAWIAHELADEVSRVTAFPVGVYRSSNGWLLQWVHSAKMMSTRGSTTLWSAMWYRKIPELFVPVVVWKKS